MNEHARNSSAMSGCVCFGLHKMPLCVMPLSVWVVAMTSAKGKKP